MLNTQQLQLDMPLAAEEPRPLAATTSPAGIPLSSRPGEPKGVVYTKQWVVDLILDLAGYRETEDLAACYAVEPAAGEGAFLISMIRRLLASMRTHGRPAGDAHMALRAYELDEASAVRAADLAARELVKEGTSLSEATDIAQSWITVGDYLLESQRNRRSDFVIGNPPYIRYDDMPAERLSEYRRIYPTMVGRGDIYVGFIEAGIRQLKQDGVLAFICADRWMRSAYGVELRRLVAKTCGVDVLVEMHDAPAFENEVAAYPAIIVLRRGAQQGTIVASAGADAGPLPDTASLGAAVIRLADGAIKSVRGFSAARTDWQLSPDPWPSVDPDQIAVIERLERESHPLEDRRTGTRISIGVATGADRVFVTTKGDLVEPDRMLPLAMAADTRDGTLKWSGHYLVDPWERAGGLVDLASFPRLRDYFERHRTALECRNIARRYSNGWYRTIDRVTHGLIQQPKLYFPDMKLASNPVLDTGGTYPHHNLYYLVSTTWDLEVLGGILLSRVAQLFIEAYCVKMRGGTLRFQAQYLRRIRVPDPGSLPEGTRDVLRAAFRSRDANAATAAAIEAYRIGDLAGAFAC